MGPNTQQQQISSSEASTGFSLGVSSNAGKNNKVKSAAEVAEQRRLEMF